MIHKKENIRRLHLEDEAMNATLATRTLEKASITHESMVACTRLNGFMAIQRDIIERNQSEKDTILGDRLKSMNNDLRQFSYMISHNLRGPIARILGLINILQDDPGNEKFIIQKIYEETTNIDTIIKDINIINSAHDSQIEKTTYVNFESEVELVRHSLRAEIDESGATITTNFEEVAGINTVRAYLNSILHNLISNALKFRSDNVLPNIHINAHHDNSMICLSVTDNGLGIDMKTNGEKLFALYRKFHGLRFPGRGIGLSLVKAQVEALDGRIEVSSEINQGSTFRIYLPVNHKFS